MKKGEEEDTSVYSPSSAIELVELTPQEQRLKCQMKLARTVKTLVLTIFGWICSVALFSVLLFVVYFSYIRFNRLMPVGSCVASENYWLYNNSTMTRSLETPYYPFSVFVLLKNCKWWYAESWRFMQPCDENGDDDKQFPSNVLWQTWLYAAPTPSTPFSPAVGLEMTNLSYSRWDLESPVKGYRAAVFGKMEYAHGGWFFVCGASFVGVFVLLVFVFFGLPLTIWELAMDTRRLSKALRENAEEQTVRLLE